MLTLLRRHMRVRALRIRRSAFRRKTNAPASSLASPRRLRALVARTLRVAVRAGTKQFKDIRQQAPLPLLPRRFAAMAAILRAVAEPAVVCAFLSSAALAVGDAAASTA